MDFGIGYPYKLAVDRIYDDYIAGIQNIPTELVEAAQNRWSD